MPNKPDGVAVDITDRWVTAGGEPARAGYEVRINGAPLPCPVAAYEVMEGDRGPGVVLTVAADRVSVTNRPAPTTVEGRAAATWGAPAPDPRESIPGWTEAVGRG